MPPIKEEKAAADALAKCEPFKTVGLDIEFPFEPYGIQKAMMSRISTTLTNKAHCLIESPTGTGKTLVLLCSTLAWQKKSKALSQPYISAKLRKLKADERRERLRNRPCTCGRRPNRSELDELKEAKENCKAKQADVSYGSQDEVSACKRIKVECDSTSASYQQSVYFKKDQQKAKVDQDIVVLDLDEDDDCQIIGSEHDTTQKPKQEPDQQTKTTSTSTSTATGEPLLDQSFGTDEKPMCKACQAVAAEEKFTEILGEESMDGEDFISTKVSNKIPRIYYGTRTHKQISQVVRELNKTPYKKDLRMCILSSRERTCINDEVKTSANRNDKCRELIKNKQSTSGDKRRVPTGETCSYYHDSNTIAQFFEQINIDYKDKAWDIEDAGKFGQENSACPYYGVRALQEQADITFSPYNYLLDPAIRRTLNINLNNSIIILDEAHNIEDICRDSASFVITTKDIDDILDTINIAASHYVQGSLIMDAYQYFKNKFLQLKSYMIQSQFNQKSNDSDYIEKKVLTQAEMLHDLQSVGLGPDCLQQVRDNMKALRGDDESESGEKSSKNSDNQQPALSFAQMQYITQLTITLEFMYNSNNKYLSDYRAVVTKSLERDFNRFSKQNGANKAPAEGGDKFYWKLSLLCMNSGIAFEKIHSSAWSVIVASGTLSPIESLKSELGCKFDGVFEGAHVIKEARVFASILSSGPQNVDLNCSYTNSLSLGFQDEVGRVIKDVCTSVPNGILVFFPSYDRMESFYQRWFSTGVMKAIQKAGKKSFRERKNLSVADFEAELEKYNNFARRKGGAILFAVFRGKVSEGIDFADKAARAVITIGIPYPNVKDTTVGLKREYNDVARSQRPHLMTGGDWYSSQAFRALNQALGRCIRHKDDWGAVIMIDSRLKWHNSINSISKWLRINLNTNNEYSRVYDDLQDFVERLSLEE